MHVAGASMDSIMMLLNGDVIQSQNSSTSAQIMMRFLVYKAIFLYIGWEFFFFRFSMYKYFNHRALHIILVIVNLHEERQQSIFQG